VAKLTDYLARAVQASGIDAVHTVTGGAVVHILDSLNQVGIRVICYHNEQAAALGAVGETKYTKAPSLCVVTTGPGGTNALTGLAAAWLDSVPVIFISGQARFEHLSVHTGVRQVGTQELNIVAPAATMSKFAETLKAPHDLPRLIGRAVHEVQSGRPGPVWLDIPLDFQWFEFDEVNAPVHPPTSTKCADTGEDFKGYLRAFAKAVRPAFLMGGGISVSARQRMAETLEKLGLPYALTYTGLERVDRRSSRCNMGVAGIAGSREANSVLNNSDFVTIVGSHVPVPLTGARIESWCRGAVKSMVNIDPIELENSRVHLDYKLEMDSAQFVEEMVQVFASHHLNIDPEWLEFTRELSHFREPRETASPPYVDLYSFVDVLSTCLRPDDVVVVDGGGTINAAAFVSLRPYASTPIIMSSGLCAMGSGIPEMVGAFVGARDVDRSYLLLVGDGSLQFNIQELNTVQAHNIPARIFVFNNDGYSSIRNTQSQFLNQRFLGVSPKDNLWFPSLKDVAKTFGFSYEQLNSGNFSHETVGHLLRATSPPILVEVVTDPRQKMGPSQAFIEQGQGRFVARSLATMSPALDASTMSRLAKWVVE